MRTSTENILAINLIIALILYMSILLPLVSFFNVDMMIFPIIIVIHNIILWSLIVNVEKKNT